MSSRGSIRREQNGGWSFVVDLPSSGHRRRQVRRRGFNTRRDAQAALTELIGDVQRGGFVKLDRVTVGDYLRGWMEALPMTGRKESTVSSYRHNLRLHVLPHLEGIPLQALTHDQDPPPVQQAPIRGSPFLDLRRDVGPGHPQGAQEPGQRIFRREWLARVVAAQVDIQLPVGEPGPDPVRWSCTQRNSITEFLTAPTEPLAG